MGRSLALLLAAQRLRVALVNNAANLPAGHSDVRAYSLNMAAKQLLTDLRCWPEGDACTPILTMNIEGDQGGDLNFDATQQGVEALNWMVDVPTLEKNLATAVSFQPLIEELSVPVAAPLTVICEGRASQTRAELGVQFDVKHYAQHALACRIQTDAPHGQVARQWFQNMHGAEVLAFLPIGGANSHQWAIVWSLTPDRAQELSKADAAHFCQQLVTASGDIAGNIQLISERAVWPLQLARATHWTGSIAHASSAGPAQAFALAGDAAHTIHPLAGQGLNLGLRDVAVLLNILGKRESFRSPSDLVLLRRYERQRQGDTSALLWVTDKLKKLFSASSNTERHIRNWGLGLVNKSHFIKQRLIERALGEIDFD